VPVENVDLNSEF